MIVRTICDWGCQRMRPFPQPAGKVRRLRARRTAVRPPMPILDNP
jgi:hypothetical protein